jgi:hypothetical protein
MPTSYGITLPITVPQLSDQANIVTALTDLYYGSLDGATATPTQLLAEQEAIGGHIQRLVTNKANYTDNLGVFADTTSAQLLSTLTDATGTGNAVFSTSPTLVTPSLGVATATSINETTIPTNKTLVTTSDTGTVTSTMILDGTIVNADVSNSAAIAYPKLSLTGSIVNADINASAAIAKTKISGTAVTLADTGTVTSTMIENGTIVNEDISASAAIAISKFAVGVDGQILRVNSGVATWVDPLTVPSGDAAKVANKITFNSSGTGAASGLQYDGAADPTVSYNTIGAAPLSHTHGNITNAGAIGTTSGLMIKTTTSGVLTTLPAGTSGQYLQHDGTWSTPAGTYSLPTAEVAQTGGIRLGSAAVQSASSAAVGTTSLRTYLSQLNSSGQLVVNVPWTDTVYTLPTASTSDIGGVRIDGTSITISSGTISAPASTYYAATGSATTSSTRNKTFVSPDAPTGAVAGDLWFW